MPIFILALVRIRVLSSATSCGATGGSATPLMLAFADPAARPSIPSRSLFEVIPLLILFEVSIWLSVVMEKRWDRNLPAERTRGRL